MTNATSTSNPMFSRPLSRLAVLRDLAVVGLCLAACVGFVAELAWGTASAPAGDRAVTQVVAPAADARG